MVENVNEVLVDKIKEAWSHANESRPLSLTLALENIAFLMEMRGDGNIRSFVEESECGYKDRLAAISEYLGLRWQSFDSGVWHYPLSGEVSGPPDYIPQVKFVEYT